MNLTDLDEWQGLTSDMVQQWAEGHGYQYRVSGLVKGGYVSFANPLRPDAIGWLVPLLADRAKLSPQAFLREINPRMRKGMPSQAAREVHGPDGGMWVACRGELGNGGTIVFVCFESDSEDGLPLAIWDCDEWEHWEVEPVEIENEWFFWPCDVSGNKVRWPTDPEGNML